MDLKAANIADERASRWTRNSMIACMVIAAAMLIASLAMAQVNETQFKANTFVTMSGPH